MAETSKATCSSCRYYADDSTCRRRPPRLVKTRKLLISDGEGDHLSVNYQHSPMWPAVIGWLDWCGEWTQQRTEGLPALLSTRALNLGDENESA